MKPERKSLIHAIAQCNTCGKEWGWFVNHPALKCGACKSEKHLEVLCSRFRLQ